jgi:hypothetical protein
MASQFEACLTLSCEYHTTAAFLYESCQTAMRRNTACRCNYGGRIEASCFETSLPLGQPCTRPIPLPKCEIRPRAPESWITARGLCSHSLHTLKKDHTLGLNNLGGDLQFPLDAPDPAGYYMRSPDFGLQLNMSKAVRFD